MLRYPGYALSPGKKVEHLVIQWVGRQLELDTAAWRNYATRDETRREHVQTLLAYLGLSPFGLSEFRALVHEVTELALQSDKGLVLATQAMQSLLASVV